MFKRQRWNLQPALWSRLLRRSCRGSRSTRLKVCSRFSPVWAQEKQGEKADLLLSEDLDPTSSASWVSDFSVVLGGVVADQTFRGTWLSVTGLITPSVDCCLEVSAHDGVIYSQGGASLHINHAQEHLQISPSSWSASPLFSFEPSLLHIWKAIPAFLCNTSNFRVILQLYLIPYTQYICYYVEQIYKKFRWTKVSERGFGTLFILFYFYQFVH